MQSKFEVVPIVQLKSGLFVKGKLLGPGRAVNLKDKKSGRDYVKFVHEFSLMDCADEVTFTANGANGYETVTPDEGDKVSIWATKSLHEKLEMFPEGTILRITEDGQEDAGGEFKRRKFVVKMEAK